VQLVVNGNPLSRPVAALVVEGEQRHQRIIRA
jgi:hypothetical protein